MSDNVDDKLLYLLQKGLPLEPRPFRVIADEVGVSEEYVLEKVKSGFKEGLIRRLGSVFDSRSLGYNSTLCAIDVPEYELDAIADKMQDNHGITHSYLRDGNPNLWFTLTAHENLFDSEISNLTKLFLPYEISVFPAIKKFKVQVLFDPTGKNAKDNKISVNRNKVSYKLTEQEKNIVRYMQGNIPVSKTIFADAAAKLGYEKLEFIELLKKWKECGILRRVGIIVRHYKLGFKGNAMCLWQVDIKNIQEKGEALAATKEVSHCYERKVNPSFPFNLYAMIHSDSIDGVRDVFEKISKENELPDGKMMLSIKEYKKSSPRFFSEESE